MFPSDRSPVPSRGHSGLAQALTEGNADPNKTPGGRAELVALFRRDIFFLKSDYHIVAFLGAIFFFLASRMSVQIIVSEKKSLITRYNKIPTQIPVALDSASNSSVRSSPHIRVSLQVAFTSVMSIRDISTAICVQNSHYTHILPEIITY